MDNNRRFFIINDLLLKAQENLEDCIISKKKDEKLLKEAIQQLKTVKTEIQKLKMKVVLWQ